MYYSTYFWFLGPILLCMLFAMLANRKVKTSFETYDRVRTRSGLTGFDTVTRLMRTNNVFGISVGRVQGTLSDHYHPANQIVNLYESTYGSNSVAAVAVALLMTKKGK